MGRYFDIGRRIMLGGSEISVDGSGVEHYPLFAACFAEELGERAGPDMGGFPEYLLRRPNPISRARG